MTIEVTSIKVIVDDANVDIEATWRVYFLFSSPINKKTLSKLLQLLHQHHQPPLLLTSPLQSPL